MARVDFTPENKIATVNYDFPKLKLKSGERARIMAGLELPVMEYVHTLRKPLIINGVPQMETKERKDKSTYETNKTAFVGSPLCLGDPEVLKERGSDPAHCPACKAAKDYPDYFQEPKPRYAMHVIRYRTKSGTTDLATPFSVELLVWAFSVKTFNKIIDFKAEWGDLRKHDFLLGPCISENFQTYDITVAAKAEWLGSEDRKARTVATFKENQIPDLTIAVGSVKQKQWIEQDIETVLESWSEVVGATATLSPDTDLETDLNDLLSAPDTDESIEALTGAPDLDVDLDDLDVSAEGSDDMLDDLLASSVTDVDAAVEEFIDLDTGEVLEPETPAEAPAAKKKATKAAAPAPEAAPDVDNFDDLLAGM